MSETLGPAAFDPDVLKTDGGWDAEPDHEESPGVIVALPRPSRRKVAKHVEVAFCRTLKPGMRGADVVSHKRAVSRAMPKVYPWGVFTDLFGPQFVEAVKAVQTAHAIPSTGVIGTTTHIMLENAGAFGKSESAFDSLAQKFAADFCNEYVKTPVERAREAAVAAWLYWYSKREQTAYSQYRPMWLGVPPDWPPRADCSGFATAGCRAGGLSDPNQRGYDGLGYTGTLIQWGSRIARIEDLEIADMVFYGSSVGRPGFRQGDPTHVAPYAGHGMVVSNGHYPMGYYPYNYRGINHLRHYPYTVTARAFAMEDA